MDESRFATAIGTLGEAFRQKITATTIRAYRIGLRALKIDNIEAAIAKAIEQCKFMPTPSELSELSGVLRPEDRAVVAWQVVRKAGANRWESIQFDDPCVTATIRNLWSSWIGFCDAVNGTNDLMWIRKDFERVYVSLLRGGLTCEMTRPLTGLLETQFHDKALQKLLQRDSPTTRLVACGLPAIRIAPAKISPSLPKQDIKLLGCLRDVNLTKPTNEA